MDGMGGMLSDVDPEYDLGLGGVLDRDGGRENEKGLLPPTIPDLALLCCGDGGGGGVLGGDSTAGTLSDAATEDVAADDLVGDLVGDRGVG